MMEGKIAAIGDHDFVMPLASIGLDAYAVGDGGEELVEAVEKVLAAGYAMVVVSEDKYAAAGEAFSPAMDRPLPCVAVVPFTHEPTGAATKALSEMLKSATGIDIFGQ
jgi:vacuolar-type H+-ATPase subunit F/Vma7